MKKKAWHKELKEQAPRLAKLKEKNLRPDLPDGYFSDLEKRVFRRLNEEQSMSLNSNQQRRLPLYSVLQWVAAVVLLAAIATWIYTHRKVENLQEASLTSEEVEFYILEHLDEFDEGILVEQADKLSFDWTAWPSESANPLENVSDEELDGYLDSLLDGIDETTLENLL